MASGEIELMLADADRQSVEALTAVEPAWTGMSTAADALGLEKHTLLHCGPPASPSHALVQPILNSAAVACVFEGWVDDIEEALRLVQSGSVRFEPAQDHHAATPMAAVVSPSMQLIKIADLGGGGETAYAPINGGGHGGSPVPRYGRRAPECVQFLRFLNEEVAEMLASACAEPLPWLPIIDHSLVNGDDTHLRHAAAHAHLMDVLRSRLGRRHADTRADRFLRKWPIVHLNFWMAAVRCLLDSASGVASSSLVTAFGGNGENFGIQVSGLPGMWFAVPATPPIGKLRDGFVAADTTGAFGDSAIIEAFGLGALAHRYAPQMQWLLGDHDHDDLLALPSRLLATVHPRLPRSRARVGLIARSVLAHQATPVVELGIVDRTGKAGGLGAGLYRPPLNLFFNVCTELERDNQIC